VYVLKKNDFLLFYDVGLYNIMHNGSIDTK